MHTRIVAPAAFGLFLQVLCLETGAVAENLPSYYLRSLAVTADAIVTATPVEGRGLPPKPVQDWEHRSSFRVREVLKGDAKLADTTVEAIDHGLFALGNDGIFGKTKPVELKEVLLFLSSDSDGGWTLDHLYGLTTDGWVVRPRQSPTTEDPYIVNSIINITWDETLGIVRRFLPQIAALRALHDIADPVARNRAIFDWVRRHRSEFTDGWFLSGNPSYEPRMGWGKLQAEVFDWILESGNIEDTWRVLELRADVSHFKSSDWGPPSGEIRLAHPEGRAFLLSKLLDADQPLAARRTAAACLSSSLTFRRDDEKAFPSLKAVTLAEQESIIQAVQHLAFSEDVYLRRSVLSLLIFASDPFYDADRPPPTKLAFPTLAKALLAEQDRDINYGLVERLNRLMDESEWRQLTGNAARICVTLSTSLDEKGRIRFTIHSVHLPHGASLPVELTLERLDESGDVVETLAKELRAEPGKAWPEEWQGAFFNLEPLNTSELSPGPWRLRMKGTSADAQMIPWQSWHTFVTVP